MRIVVMAIFAAFLFAACVGGGDSDAPSEEGGAAALESREGELRDTVENAIRAFLDGDADAFYDNFSSDFQARCDRNDFRAILALATVFIGDLSDRAATIDITNVRFEEDRAYVDAKIDVEGADIEGENEEGSFTDFWVLEDGKWKADTTEENPCDLGEGLFGGSTPDTGDQATPPTGPGTSRAEAVPLGESVTTGDLRVTVLGVDLDAANEIIAQDDFVDPPSRGNRYVLIDVRAEHAGEGEETVTVSTTDFELTGSRNVIYDNFGDDCGFYSGQINGEMFPGGSLEGSVCFEVPEDETGLILIVSPFSSFDGQDRRFLALE